MAENFDLNLNVVNKQVHHINDSLKLASGKGRYNLENKLWAKWNPFVSLERISIESCYPLGLSCGSPSSLVSGQDYELDEGSSSSIEVTRDTSSAYPKDRPSWGGCLLIEGDFPPYNSTLIEKAKTGSAVKCAQPLLSPIGGALAVVELVDHDKPGERGRSQKVGDEADAGGDPKWLSSSARNLTPLPPKTYTPRTKRDFASIVLERPSKQPFRTSSPSTSGQSIKAKRLMMDKLELSSISDEELIDDSLELVPRPSPPGTVNSDEIVPYTPSSLDDKSWNCDMNVQRYAAAKSRESSSHQENCDPDVIGLLPAPAPAWPFHVRRVQHWRRLYGERDILEGSD